MGGNSRAREIARITGGWVFSPSLGGAGSNKGVEFQEGTARREFWYSGCKQTQVYDKRKKGSANGIE